MYELEEVLNSEQSPNLLVERIEQTEFEQAPDTQVEEREDRRVALAPRRSIFTAAVLLLTRWR